MAQLTRRRFLVGATAAGAAVVGGAGIASAARYHGVRRALHGVGLIDGPDQAIPAVDPYVEYGTLDSAFTRQRPGYGICRPQSAPELTLYCLHGRGGSHRDAFEHIGVHRFVAAAGLPWVVAAVDGGESFWHTRLDGVETQRMLLEEFMPLVAAAAPSVPSAAIGWSMGGFGVLTIALARGDVFHAVVASSPSLWTSFSASPAGAFDNETDFESNDVIRHASDLDGRAIRIDCGRDDVFADAVSRVGAAAPRLDVNIHDGFHDDATWRSFLPDQIDFIHRSLGG